MSIGFIGGSGFYNLNNDSGGEIINIETPYGQTSSPIHKQTVCDHTVFFLPRHGKGHTILPSEINYRANLFALKKLGVTSVISVSAVGSLRKEIAPGHLILPDQYIDLTGSHRANTYFGSGIVAHAHFADPACKTLRNHIYKQAKALRLNCHYGGIYVCIEGPQFSTRAESHLYRSWSNEHGTVSVIGMTAMPEARLARELGLCYQTLAMATDYDCWNEGHEDVSVESITKTLEKNVAHSQALIAAVLGDELPKCRCGCANLTKNAVITARENWPAERQAEMELILS